MIKHRFHRIAVQGLVSATVWVCLSGIAAQRAENPIVRHMFTADPSAHVWEDGRLYVYPSTDRHPAYGCDRMDGYHVFSTDDMLNWKDHGEILHSRDVEWGRLEGGFMWAPDCAYKDGTYYYYFPHPSKYNWSKSWKIGVATSASPAGPFEVQGFIKGLKPIIDPCVFIDDDGQAYLIQGGGGVCYGGKLKDNMMEIDGAMTRMEGLQDFHEGPWLFKRKGVYYMIYPDNFKGHNRMRYAVAKNPLGPWTSKGIILDPVPGSYTTHGSVVEFKGKWYLFYHNAALSGHIGNLRSVCFDEMFFNADGTIQKVKQTLPNPLWPADETDGNIIKNHSFEQTVGTFFYNWETKDFRFFPSDEDVKDGKIALKYKGDRSGFFSKGIHMQDNTTYELSYWIKLRKDTKGSVILDSEHSKFPAVDASYDLKSAAQWINKKVTIHSGKEKFMRLRFRTSDDFNGTFFLDNVTLKKK